MQLNNSTFKVVGALTAIAEAGMTPSDFFKRATVARALHDHPQREALLRKAASIVEASLASHESTRHKKSRYIMQGLSKTADWLPPHYRILRAAFDPQTEKQAFNKDSIELLPDVAALLALSGALAGGVAHFAKKHVDSDDVEIEKERAVTNEYVRLLNELDRRITAQALKERRV